MNNEIQISSSDVAVGNQQMAEYLGSILGTTRDLISQMGDFLASLKPINEKFAVMADKYYGAVNRLVDKENGEPGDFEAILTNLAYAVATQGIGSLISAIRTQQAIQKAKAILKADAEKHLPSLTTARELLDQRSTEIFDQMNMMITNGAYLDQLRPVSEELRVLLYIFHIVEYLIATYEEALKGNFQDSVAYPSMYTANQVLLYNVLTNTPEAASDAQILENRRKSIDSLLDEATAAMESGSRASGKILLFCNDARLMSTAIHDYVPVDSAHEDEDGFTEVNEDAMLPLSASLYHKFVHLMTVAEQYPRSSLSNAVNGNKALKAFTRHMTDMIKIGELYESRTTIYGINLLLVGILAFLASWDKLDLAWYWALLIGIVVYAISAKLVPWKKINWRFKKKQTYLERTIQLSNLERAGYVEVPELHEIEKANDGVWLGIIIGGILGFCFIPFPGGLIIGGLIGAWLGSSKDDDPIPDYDYTKISLGSDWKAKVILVCLILCVIAYIVLMIISD